MACKLDLPLGPSFRDAHIEADLQGRLDDGRKIWAIGDIHGHLGTFRALIHRLKLDPEDRVVCLGDMIDRGPDSAGLVEFIRSHPQIICLKGNHELMAMTSLQEDGSVELWRPWLERGGRSTWGSYIVRAHGDLYEAKKQFANDLMWMDNLPNHIVLDNLRLVHAGYDPRMPLDMQGDKELCGFENDSMHTNMLLIQIEPLSLVIRRRPRLDQVLAMLRRVTFAFKMDVLLGLRWMLAPTTMSHQDWLPSIFIPSKWSNKQRFVPNVGSMYPIVVKPK